MTKYKKKFQTHFRKFHDKKTTAHPQYVYGEDGKKYKILGITESSKTNGVANVLLDRNPNPDSNKTAYVRTQPDTINKGVRNEKLKGWSFDDSDKPKIMKILGTDKRKKRTKKKVGGTET